MENFQLFKNTNKHVNTILTSLNGYRSQVAIGLTPLPPAQKMMQLYNSVQLSEIANRIAERGYIVKDACLTAYNFHYPVVNQKILQSKGPAVHPEDFGEMYIHSINSWAQNQTSQEFRNMIEDVSSYVGCSIGYWKERNAVTRYKSHVVCVFSSSFFHNQLIYISGEPGSNCEKKGTIPGLCA